jgi:hypothetical protein
MTSNDMPPTETHRNNSTEQVRFRLVWWRLPVHISAKTLTILNQIFVIFLSALPRVGPRPLPRLQFLFSLIASPFHPVVLLSKLLTPSLNKLNIIQFLQYVTPCYWLSGSRRFERPWCLHLQGSRSARWTLMAGTECQSRTAAAYRYESLVVRPDAQIPDSRWTGPLNFVRCRLIFVGPQRGT